MTNTFYLAANIMFDLDTGKKTNVLLLANSEGDATYFTEPDARSYMAFVQGRSPEIKWTITRSNQRLDMYVIKGVQNV
jgi:hypothetical protein